MADTMKRTDLDFSAYKTRLLELKNSTEETLSRMTEQDADGLNTTGTDRAESSVADNHPGDLGTELQLRAQDAALMENERNTLVQIERALAKIEDGTYGFSDRSGALIPQERLDAMPQATLTVEEAEAGEYQATDERYNNA